MIVDKILLLKISFIQSFGYLIVFLATLLEASPGIGIFIPGSVIIFIAGFISKSGFLNLWAVMAFAILGAILGDLGGYLFGLGCGKGFLHKYCRYLLIKKEYIDWGGDIIKGHTGKALVFGRINPVTRSAAPFISGCHKVSFWKFIFFNAIGGIIWGFTFVSLGYIFGQGFRIAVNFEKWLMLITLMVIGIFYMRYFLKLLMVKAGGSGKIVELSYKGDYSERRKHD